MQFTTRKRRGTPTVIIVSLIDVLIVVLIFLMVTTTFKQQPALKLVLPKSSQPQTGATADAVIVTIPKTGPLYFKKDPVTTNQLQRYLNAAVAANPDVILAIRADTAAAWGKVVQVRDAANAAHIKTVNASVETDATP